MAGRETYTGDDNQKGNNMFTKDARVSQKVTKSNVKHNDPPRKGTVIALTDDPNKVVVEWDKGWSSAKSEVAKVDVSGLMLEAAAAAEFDRLSAEFEKVEEAIRLVVQESADKLTEAMKMASAHGEELAELHEAVYPLLRAMDSAGWRTSSLHC